MKKVLFTINFLTNGGPTRVLENIISQMNPTEYKVYVLTIIDENESKIIDKFKSRGVEILEFKYSKSLGDVLKHKKDIFNAIKEVNPDVIHTHGIVTTLLIALYKGKSKKITTIHNNIFEDYRFTYGKIKGMLYAFFHILLLKKFNETICCSKTSYNVLKKYDKKATFIRNGIDIEFVSDVKRDDIRKELNISEDSIIFIYGGVINNRKRVCELVDMFKKSLNDNEYLVIIGDGELMDKAVEIAGNMNNIKFLGFKKNIIDYFKAADVYVSNSSSEGFSISVIEALECNLLLLLSDIPSHKECFEIDNNYYIGEFFTEENFSNKKDNVVKKLSQSVNTKAFKEKYLSSKAMANDYKKFY